MENALKKTLSLLLILFSLQGVSQSGESVTGNLLYHGVSPMPNVHVYLYEDGGDFVDSTMTNSTGVWSFTNLEPGDYYVTFYKDGPSAGVNLTDAYLVMAHILFGYPFTEIQALAADVNGNGYITWTDYFIILVNYLNQGNPFPIGNWVFEPLEFNPYSRDGLTVSGTSSGDANGTFVPTKSFEVQNIINPSTVAVTPGADFRLELGSATEQLVGGMHLVLDIPEGVEITGVDSELEDIKVDVSKEARQVRFTWMDTESRGFLLNNGSPLIHLTARISRESSSHDSFQFDISPESHFINLKGEVIGGIDLAIPTVTLSKDLEVNTTLYPNPFVNQATLEFNAGVTGQVNLRIYDSGGKLIREVNDASVQNGFGSIQVDGASLLPGMYFYQLVQTDSNAILKTGQMIKSK